MNDCGLLLLNLGSPDSFSVPDVKKYLQEFLMDERVIDAPYLVRSLIVKGFILPFRPKRSAHAYSKVWTKDGSPLIAITESFKKEIEQLVDMPVAIAMRYGNPTPQKAIEELLSKNKDLKQLYVAPLYPHYAMSSYETAMKHVLNQIGDKFSVKVLKPFYKEENYIASLSESIRPHLFTSSHPHILFSYHGLPVRHLKKSDCTGEHCYTKPNCCDVSSKAWDTCYKHQVITTSKLVAEKLDLSEDQYSISFQSRLGRDEWIKPFTVELLESYPSKGIKDLVIVCPAFVADCLETLEEIAIAGKEIFMNAGGESFKVVPLPEYIQTVDRHIRFVVQSARSTARNFMGMKIAVVGAGISGLSLAYRLKKEGNDVVVFESSARTGGKIGTVYCDGLELDLGPVSIAETPELVDLASELGIRIIKATNATKIRYVFSKGRLHKASPVSSLLSFRGKISMLNALFTSKTDEDESVASYATRRFGKEAYQRLFNPLMNGIYAGNAELLSARSVIKNRKPRKIVSLEGGIAALTNALASKLCVELDAAFDDFNSFEQVYLTTPAYVTANLIAKLDKGLAHRLANIHYSSLSQIYVETVPGQVKFDGFGFLVPTEERMSLLGAVCVSNIFPSKVTEGRRLFVLFCGGDRPYDFKSTVEGAVNEFKNILQPALAKVIHVEEYANSIPQFYVGHGEILKRIADFELRNPKIKIKGNFVTGVAVGDCL